MAVRQFSLEGISGLVTKSKPRIIVFVHVCFVYVFFRFMKLLKYLFFSLWNPWIVGMFAFIVWFIIGIYCLEIYCFFVGKFWDL